MTKIVTDLKMDGIKHNFSDPGTDKKRFNRIILNCFVYGNYITESINEERTIKTFRSFYSKDRYFFDFNMDLTQWLQMDTDQDAPYYGNWCNPMLKATLSYTEGDICVNVADSDETFLQLIHEARNWNIENGYRFSIDPGLNPNKSAIEFMKKYKESIRG